MRESQNLFWGDTTKKQVAFTIIWTIGIICWGYFFLQFTERLHEADWAYSEAMKIRQERIENNKGDGQSVGEIRGETDQISSTEKQDTPDQSAGEKTSSLPAPGIEEVIYAYFQDDYKTAKAVFTAESGLNSNAQGFNCYYEKAGKTVSEACRKGDEDRAWSTDCGIAQINVAGKVCPLELFDPNHNLEVARQKYEARKWQPWSAWKSGKYLAFL